MRVGNASHDQTDDDRNGVSHDEACSGDGVGIVKGLISADRGDRVKDGSGEHVGERAGNREAVFNESTDNWHDGAFTNRKDDSKYATHEDGEGAIFGEPALESIFWKICSEKSTDNGAEKNKRKAFEKNREEFEGGILEL